MDRITVDDGTEIAWATWGDPGVGTPVVLHHGFAVDHRMNWVLPGVVDALVAAGRAVVAVDARGHGASGCPHDPARYGEARMAEDVCQVVDHLGVARYDLVGYSMGAIVATLVASRDPRVRRLSLGGVGEALVVLGGVDQRVVSGDDIAAALEVPDPADIAHPGAGGFRVLADAVGADRLALAAQARSVHAGAIPFGRIVAPTLVVAGADDELAAHPGRLVAALPDARLCSLPGDHLAVPADPAYHTALVEHLAG